MMLIDVPTDQLEVSREMARSRTSKVFEERLRASIEQMGLAEPIKVARTPDDKYLVVDGMIRLRAIQAIRARDPTAFGTVPAYLVDLERRFEIRYQTDIYQDLLPSQLATLVEHLHAAENIQKTDIARYIGVSPATLRNYTGLWRLLQRGGLFASVVELMDAGVFPASNPYAWLRLTEDGLWHVLYTCFSDGRLPESWVDERLEQAQRGDVAPYPLKVVESLTNSLPAKYYREDEDVRSLKRELGLRRAALHKQAATEWDATEARTHLGHVARRSKQPVVRHAARALASYLQ